MANRSDADKLFPRQYKRQMALAEASGLITNGHERGEYKRAMIYAHAAFRTSKNVKREVTAEASDPTEEV
jgi:hypothetical protein